MFMEKCIYTAKNVISATVLFIYFCYFRGAHFMLYVLSITFFQKFKQRGKSFPDCWKNPRLSGTCGTNEPQFSPVSRTARPATAVKPCAELSRLGGYFFAVRRSANHSSEAGHAHRRLKR